MIIQEEDFKLEEDDGCWNLYLLKHIGGTNPRDEIQLVGYGYSLFSGLKTNSLTSRKYEKANWKSQRDCPTLCRRDKKTSKFS